MKIPSDQKYEFIRSEMQILQSILDKYDRNAVQTRNWSLTLWAASFGFAFSQKEPQLILISMIIPVLGIIAEGMIRNTYWQKYVNRYRVIRESLNSPEFDIDSFPIYDLTAKYPSVVKTEKPSSLANLFRSEHTVIYILLLIVSIGAYFLRT